MRRTKPLVYVGLLHHPVYNKNMEVITTAITNLDIHDIARSVRTYEIKKYFIIHPLAAQRELAQSIIDYWQQGFGSRYNPDRKEAFSRVLILTSLTDAEERIFNETGMSPVIVTTDARRYQNTVAYRWLRQEVWRGDRPFLLLLGTGWGIEAKVMTSAHYILEPVYGPGDFNHLSVRSAAAIILDRLLGDPWWQK